MRLELLEGEIMIVVLNNKYESRKLSDLSHGDKIEIVVVNSEDVLYTEEYVAALMNKVYEKAYIQGQASMREDD